MKKFIALLLALVMVMSLAACSVEKTEAPAPTEAPKAEAAAPAATEAAPAEPAVASAITLWTYPVGKWGDQATVEGMMAKFKEATGITVTVEYLTYADGDAKVDTAIEGGVAPDLVLEGPERLVVNWGTKGKLVDIADMFDDTAKANLIPGTMADCFLGDAAYEYPLCMNAFCMAINKTVFEAAGAMQYIDEETHTWTTENFWKAIEAVYAHTGKTVGVVFCKDQGGDQGNRVLINGLYGGKFTNDEHTEYTWDLEENIKAIKELYDNPAIAFDPSINGGEEIALFYNGTLSMATCWNAAQQANPNTANTGAEKTANGDEIMFMAFPSPNGTDIKLGAQNYGFGIFDNGDESKIAAAKEFIKYFCAGEGTVEAVAATGNFPADTTIVDVYAGSENEAILNKYYELMTSRVGDYYQATPGWTNARAQWWNMLQQIGASDGSVETITALVQQYEAAANAG